MKIIRQIILPGALAVLVLCIISLSGCACLQCPSCCNAETRYQNTQQDDDIYAATQEELTQNEAQPNNIAR